jgi:hypothetical protein
MGAKVYADCLSDDEGASSSPQPELPMDGDGDGVGAGALPEDPSAEPSSQHSQETEVQAVAAWFEALPDEWRSYFDREAESGQRAYGRA